MRQQSSASSKLTLSLDVDCKNIQESGFYRRQGFVEINKSDVSPRMQALGIGSHFHLSKKL
jgi:ribosomal protein S18 acetylase RimI-like enzyme